MMNTAYIDADKDEALAVTLLVLARRLGDDFFASALALESPAVRSAVAASANKPALKPFPKTYELISTAPKIDFPLLKLYRKF